MDAASVAGAVLGCMSTVLMVRSSCKSAALLTEESIPVARNASGESRDLGATKAALTNTMRNSNVVPTDLEVYYFEKAKPRAGDRPDWSRAGKRKISFDDGEFSSIVNKHHRRAASAGKGSWHSMGGSMLHKVLDLLSDSQQRIVEEICAQIRNDLEKGRKARAPTAIALHNSRGYYAREWIVPELLVAKDSLVFGADCMWKLEEYQMLMRAPTRFTERLERWPQDRSSAIQCSGQNRPSGTESLSERSKQPSLGWMLATQDCCDGEGTFSVSAGMLPPAMIFLLTFATMCFLTFGITWYVLLAHALEVRDMLWNCMGTSQRHDVRNIAREADQKSSIRIGVGDDQNIAREVDRERSDGSGPAIATECNIVYHHAESGRSAVHSLLARLRRLLMSVSTLASRRSLVDISC